MKGITVFKWTLGVTILAVLTAGNVVALPVGSDGGGVFHQLQGLVGSLEVTLAPEPVIMLLAGTFLTVFAGMARKNKDTEEQ